MARQLASARPATPNVKVLNYGDLGLLIVPWLSSTVIAWIHGKNADL